MKKRLLFFSVAVFVLILACAFFPVFATGPPVSTSNSLELVAATPADSLGSLNLADVSAINPDGTVTDNVTISNWAAVNDLNSGLLPSILWLCLGLIIVATVAISLKNLAALFYRHNLILLATSTVGRFGAIVLPAARIVIIKPFLSRTLNAGCALTVC